VGEKLGEKDMKKKDKQSVGAHMWIWRSLFKVSMIPILIIEILFVSIYFLSNIWIQQEVYKYSEAAVIREIQIIAKSESIAISQQLMRISEAADLFKRQLETAINTEATLAPEDEERLVSAPNGSYYSRVDNNKGGAAVFYSGYRPVGEMEIQKTANLLSLQYLMKDTVLSHSLAASIYINTHDSLNIIYPYFDVVDQYTPYMNIPSYNFYYEADLEHNPERKVVWTDAYLDPAGHGWMTSAIVPVFNDDYLEGVAGIDVTISTIVEGVLDIELPYDGYCVLVGDDGMLLAIPEEGESDFGVNELTKHRYQEAILQDTFKPENFNLLKKPAYESLTSQIFSEDFGSSQVMMAGETQVISWSTIKEPGWKLMVVIPKDSIYENAYQMKSKLFNSGMVLILFLLTLYVIYYVTLYRKAKYMSAEIAKPLSEINEMVAKISDGEYYHQFPAYSVSDIEDTANGIVQMGYHLGEANEQLVSTQEQLIKSQSELEALVASIDDIIIEIDNQGNIINHWSRRMRISTAYRDYGATYSIYSFFGDRVGDQIMLAIKDVMMHNRSARFEFEITEKDEKIWYQAKVSPVDSKKNSFVITARDITDRILMEQSVLASKEGAEKANRAKTEFISSMSHELKTPLNVILGFANLMMLDYTAPLNKTQTENVNEIVNAGTHLLDLINRILDFGTVESGQFKLKLEKVAVDVVIKDTEKMLDLLVKESNIAISMPVDHCHTSYVQADKIRLKQVLINLLTNAVKYNKPNGSIILYCEAIGDSMRFHIEDTGLGISEEELPHIFTPFYRIQSSDYGVEGAGIGLSVTKDLVEAMGGCIGATSELGIGSHFWFELKRVDDAEDVNP
jgi:PAS domain S-box-containing protein